MQQIQDIHIPTVLIAIAISQLKTIRTASTIATDIYTLCTLPYYYVYALLRLLCTLPYYYVYALLRIHNSKATYKVYICQ